MSTPKFSETTDYCDHPEMTRTGLQEYTCQECGLVYYPEGITRCRVNSHPVHCIILNDKQHDMEIPADGTVYAISGELEVTA